MGSVSQPVSGRRLPTRQGTAEHNRTPKRTAHPRTGVARSGQTSGYREGGQRAPLGPIGWSSTRKVPRTPTRALTGHSGSMTQHVTSTPW